MGVFGEYAYRANDAELGLPMRVHHVGVVARDMQRELDFIRRSMPVVGESPIVRDEIQDIDVCLIHLSGGLSIELVAGPIVDELKGRGFTYYHLCFEVDGLDRNLQHLQAAGALCVRGPMPAALFGNRRIAFVMSPIGLIELLESAP